MHSAPVLVPPASRSSRAWTISIGFARATLGLSMRFAERTSSCLPSRMALAQTSLAPERTRLRPFSQFALVCCGWGNEGGSSYSFFIPQRTSKPRSDPATQDQKSRPDLSPFDRARVTQQENSLAGCSKSPSSKAAADESIGGVASGLR